MNVPHATQILVLALMCWPATPRPQDATAGAKAAVTLVIPVEPQLFAADTTLDVQVWTAAQLAALNNNARCGVVRSVASGTEQTTCPEGVTYQRVVPERLRLPLDGAANSVDVRPSGLNAGDRFRVQISGPSRDGCNITSATLERSARAGKNSLTDVVWQTTARACLKGDVR
jgi:hypothetical protein